jgi:hypothetical protein
MRGGIWARHRYRGQKEGRGEAIRRAVLIRIRGILETGWICVRRADVELCPSIWNLSVTGCCYCCCYLVVGAGGIGGYWRVRIACQSSTIDVFGELVLQLTSAPGQTTILSLVEEGKEDFDVVHGALGTSNFQKEKGEKARVSGMSAGAMWRTFSPDDVQERVHHGQDAEPANVRHFAFPIEIARLIRPGLGASRHLWTWGSKVQVV